jgi:hypothetical protein
MNSVKPKGRLWSPATWSIGTTGVVLVCGLYLVAAVGLCAYVAIDWNRTLDQRRDSLDLRAAHVAARIGQMIEGQLAVTRGLAEETELLSFMSRLAGLAREPDCRTLPTACLARQLEQYACWEDSRQPSSCRSSPGDRTDADRM